METRLGIEFINYFSLALHWCPKSLWLSKPHLLLNLFLSGDFFFLLFCLRLISLFFFSQMSFIWRLTKLIIETQHLDFSISSYHRHPRPKTDLRNSPLDFSISFHRRHHTYPLKFITWYLHLFWSPGPTPLIFSPWVDHHIATHLLYHPSTHGSCSPFSLAWETLDIVFGFWDSITQSNKNTKHTKQIIGRLFFNQGEALPMWLETRAHRSFLMTAHRPFLRRSGELKESIK